MCHVDRETNLWWWRVWLLVWKTLFFTLYLFQWDNDGSFINLSQLSFFDLVYQTCSAALQTGYWESYTSMSLTFVASQSLLKVILSLLLGIIVFWLLLMVSMSHSHTVRMEKSIHCAIVSPWLSIPRVIYQLFSSVCIFCKSYCTTSIHLLRDLPIGLPPAVTIFVIIFCHFRSPNLTHAQSIPVPCYLQVLQKLVHYVIYI